MATSIAFFATEADLPVQLPAQAFGPVVGNTATQYRLSSLFTGSLTANKAMAHAAVSGRVLFLVSDSSPDRYNIILRPLTQSPGLPVVKYFVYRGIVKSDFLDNTNTIVTGDTCTLKTVIAKSNNPMKALEDYSSISVAAAAITSIDELFLKDDNQFATVNAGDSLGHFDNAAGFNYGLDIVLDEPGHQLTVEVGRRSDNIVDISSIVGDDAKEAARLHILAYVDPAAYYGLCMHATFGVRNNSGNTSYKKEKVYNLVKKFSTKNQVYVDIRDRWGMPQGFIGGTTSTIKVSQGAASANGSTPIPYRGTDDWPVHLLQNSFTGVTTKDGYKFFALKLSLAPDGVTSPLLHLQVGYWKKYFTKFREDVVFTKLQITSGWTSDAVAAVIAATDGSATVPAATYLRVLLTDYSNAAALNNQYPEKQPHDHEVFDLAGLYIPEWLSPPQFSAVTSPRIKTLVRMAPYLGYKLYKDAAIGFRSGVAVDQDGVVAFAIRGCHYIPLESNSDRQNEDIEKNEMESILPIRSGEYDDDGFWNFIYEKSKYEYDYSDYNKAWKVVAKQRKTTTGAIKPYKINLAGPGVNLLEVRIRDAVVIRGYDYSPAEPFVCLAYSAIERGTIEGIMHDAAKFAPIGPKFLVYDVQPVPVTGTGLRPHYHFTLHIRGLKYVGTQFTWVTEPTAIEFYSVDGENFFTNDYATAAFARIAGAVWDNSSVPDTVPPASNPYNNAGKYAASLRTTLYNHLQTLLTTDARLMDGEVRDELYDDNLEGLSFQMAFRAPFFTQRPRKVPYTNVVINSTTVSNTPYRDDFDTWFANANAIRALQVTPALGPLGRTGLTQALTDAIQTDQDHLTLYDHLGVARNASFANHHVPAYMARIMEDENSYRGYNDHPHFPMNYRSQTASHNAADLNGLVTAGLIDNTIRTYLIGLPANGFGWRRLLTPSDANGYYIVKKSNSPNFYRVHTITNMPERNNSGITIGMGFDMGQQNVSDYNTYTAGVVIPHSADSEEAIRKSRGEAICLFRLFDVDIWSGFVMPYDLAVQRTVPFMQNKYLRPIPRSMHTNVAAPHQILKVFHQTGATPFYLPGGDQYLNEVEKTLLLSQSYNHNTVAISATTNSGKIFIHAINTHDIRWMRLAWRGSTVYASRKTAMQIFLDRARTMEHYDHTRTTL